MKNNISYTVDELLEQAAKGKNRLERRELLRVVATPRVQRFLQMVFDPSIKFVVKKVPEYKPSKYKSSWNFATLHNEIVRLERMVEGAPKAVTPERATALLAQILESVCAGEAALIAGMIKKKMPIKNITKTVVTSAFPDLIKEN